MGSIIIPLAWAEPGQGWDGQGGWWPVFPILWFLLLAGVAVTFAVLYARRSRRPTPATAAEARLAERYASGDIDEHEYHQRLAVLREGNRSRKGRR